MNTISNLAFKKSQTKESDSELEWGFKILRVSKILLILIEIGPEPGKYNAKNHFSSRNSSLPSFSFGGSNKIYKKAVLHNKVEDPDLSIPGPGSYSPKSMLGREG